MRLYASFLRGAHVIGEMSVTRTLEQFSEASAAPDISGCAVPSTFVSWVNYFQR
jgi:hypothetical protein